MLVLLKGLFSLPNGIYVRFGLSIHEIVPFKVFLLKLKKEKKKIDEN